MGIRVVVTTVLLLSLIAFWAFRGAWGSESAPSVSESSAKAVLKQSATIKTQTVLNDTEVVKATNSVPVRAEVPSLPVSSLKTPGGIQAPVTLPNVPSTIVSVPSVRFATPVITAQVESGSSLSVPTAVRIPAIVAITPSPATTIVQDPLPDPSPLPDLIKQLEELKRMHEVEKDFERTQQLLRQMESLRREIQKQQEQQSRGLNNAVGKMKPANPIIHLRIIKGT